MFNKKVNYPIAVGAMAFMQGVKAMEAFRQHDDDNWEIDEWDMADKTYDIHLLKPKGEAYFVVRIVNTRTRESFVHIKCTKTADHLYKWENFHPIYTDNK